MLATVTIILVIFLYFVLVNFNKQNKINNWRKSLDLDRHEQHFTEIYNSVDGFAISRAARENKDAPEYTYGEIVFTDFIALLSMVKVNQDTVFYDLGSGTGKAVIACSMVFSNKKSYGVEIFNDLVAQSFVQQKKLAELQDYKSNAVKIKFFKNNYLQHNINDANVIFINATALFGESWELVKQKLADVAPGTIVISSSKKINNHFFVLKKQTTVRMSWGAVIVYIHEKILLNINS